jgi:hypothetical protein
MVFNHLHLSSLHTLLISCAGQLYIHQKFFQSSLVHGAHTKGPALEMSHSKNVPSLNVPWHYTSHNTERPTLKMSHLYMSHGTKRPRAQNIPQHQTSHICH